MRVVRFEENRGHAAARQADLENASNELVAIMDSDDIAVSNRFEVQLSLVDEHPEVAVIGGIINELSVVLIRRLGHELCLRLMKK